MRVAEGLEGVAAEHLEQRVVVVSPRDSIHATILALAEKTFPGRIDGMALVLDEGGGLLGVVTDGDIRRAYAKQIDFGLPVEEIMAREPVVLTTDTKQTDIVTAVWLLARDSGRSRSKMVRFVPVVDAENRPVDVLDLTDLLFNLDYRTQRVAVHGLGHVGLTLAATLGNIGYAVTGIDSDPTVVAELQEGRTRIHEPGLADMLAVVRSKENLTAVTRLTSRDHAVHVVAVGTPVDSEGEPDLEPIRSVAKSLGTLVKLGT